MSDSDSRSAESHLELEQRVRRRAHEIWLHRSHNGHDSSLEDWLQAEREVLGGDGHGSAQDRGTVVGDLRSSDPESIEELGEA